MLYNSVSWKVLIFASQISFTSHYEVTTCSDNELVLNKILAHWLYAKKNTAYGWSWWFYGKTVVLKESRFSFQYHQTAKLLISRNTSGFINTRARSCQSYYGQRFPLASFGPKEPLPLKALHCQLCWFTSSRFLFTTKTPAFPRTDRAVGGFSRCFFRIHSYLPFSLLCPCLLPKPGSCSAPSNPPRTGGLVNENAGFQRVTSLSRSSNAVTHREKPTHLSSQGCAGLPSQSTYTCCHSNPLSPRPSQSPEHPVLTPKLPILCSGAVTILSSTSLSASIIPVFQGPDSNPSPWQDSPNASRDNQSLGEINVSLSFGKQIIFCLALVGWCRCLWLPQIRQNILYLYS